MRRIKRNYSITCMKKGIKGYKSMLEDWLLDAIISSKPAEKSKKSKFSKVRAGEIEREFNKQRHKFTKSKIKNIKRNIYEIKNKKNLFMFGIEKIEKSLDKLENFHFKTKKYYDYDDDEYRGIKDIEGLFDLSNDKDYYKPIILISAFNNNYIQYESKDDKNNNNY